MKTTQLPRIVLINGLTAIMFFVSRFFCNGSYDIAFNDSYYVIRHADFNTIIATVFAFFTLIMWGVYKLNRPLITVLNWIHYSITVLCFISIPLIVKSMFIQAQPRRYYDYNSVYAEFEKQEYNISLDEWLTFVVILLVFIQLLFVFNVFRAFMIKRKSL